MPLAGGALAGISAGRSARRSAVGWGVGILNALFPSSYRESPSPRRTDDGAPCRQQDGSHAGSRMADAAAVPALNALRRCARSTCTKTMATLCDGDSRAAFDANSAKRDLPRQTGVSSADACGRARDRPATTARKTASQWHENGSSLCSSLGGRAHELHDHGWSSAQ